MPRREGLVKYGEVWSQYGMIPYNQIIH